MDKTNEGMGECRTEFSRVELLSEGVDLNLKVFECGRGLKLWRFRTYRVLGCVGKIQSRIRLRGMEGSTWRDSTAEFGELSAGLYPR